MIPQELLQVVQGEELIVFFITLRIEEWSMDSRSNSLNTRLRTLLTFPSPRTFEKASRRQAFLMLDDLEMLAKSEVAYLNVLLNLNVHSNISKILVPGNISKLIVLEIFPKFTTRSQQATSF